jgi:bifunctional non-homologous end joining protein LigD
MGIELYRRKRTFEATPEPRGRPVPRDPGSLSSGRYVVQRHRARRLHYDFRLEIGGMLVSWAVPRGPSLDPADRRLAVRVEDHPIEYFSFEGTIPSGQYGAGDVIVWDWGTWTADPSNPDARAALERGELKFRLDGVKLRGGFVLVRTAGLGGRGAQRDKWLLIHRKDDEAVPGWRAEDHPESVKTGRTNDELVRGDGPAANGGSPRRSKVAAGTGSTR